MLSSEITTTKYDFLIAGSGLFGSTFARVAADLGKKCLVIDKNDYIGGMAADKYIEGIHVSMHGAHIFHTQSEEIWKFVNQFSEFNSFVNRPKIIANNELYSFPLNLMTFNKLWGVVTPQEAVKKLQEVCIPCDHPRNFEEWILSKVGREVYELFFYGYTKKQWMREPSGLPASIIQRLPIRLNYDDNYFSTKYQGMPVHGYTNLIRNMLDGIPVSLGQDFFDLDWNNIANQLVFTGPIDRFYEYKYGKLDYKSMRFEHQVLDEDLQGNAVFNYADESVPYLRIVEHKYFYNNSSKHYKHLSKTYEGGYAKSVVSYDYPCSEGEPYYPIRDDHNSKLYSKYEKLSSGKNVIFGGRLGSYMYHDMDQTIASAIQKAKKACED